MKKSEYMEKTGYSMAEIARAIGKRRQAVRQWGDKLPSRHALALVALAKQRGVEISAEEILS